MTVITQHLPVSRLGTVLVCHSELLVGSAAATVLERRGVVRTAVAVTSLTRLLSHLNPGVDAALVSDSVREDIPELFEAMRHRGLTTPVLISSDHVTADRAAQAFEWGAAGLIASMCSAEELCTAIVDAQRGNAVVPPGLRGATLEALRARRVQRFAAQRRLAELSAIDRQILRALTDGMSVSRIAAALSLSPHTVRSHLRVIGDKLAVRGQLRIAAVGRGLLATAWLPVWEVPAGVPELEGA